MPPRRLRTKTGSSGPTRFHGGPSARAQRVISMTLSRPEWQGTFAPAALRMLREVFDEVWAFIAPRIGKSRDKLEFARNDLRSSFLSSPKTASSVPFKSPARHEGNRPSSRPNSAPGGWSNPQPDPVHSRGHSNERYEFDHASCAHQPRFLRCTTPVGRPR